MKKPYKFVLPLNTSKEIKARSQSYGLSASGLFEIIIESLRDSQDVNAAVLSQVDDMAELTGVCYAVCEEDFQFIKDVCARAGVTKRIVIMAALRTFIEKFHAPCEQIAGTR
jgi:hypothetical protein